MTWLAALDFEEKVCLLHGAHFLIARFLNCYFGEDSDRFSLRHADALRIHLHLRLLIEDILMEEGFDALREDYFCPLGSLHEIHPMSYINWQRRERDSVNRFQSKVAELYMRTGTLPLSKLDMFAGLFKDLERLLEKCMAEPAQNYQNLLAGIDRELRWLEAQGQRESPRPERKARTRSRRSRAKGNGKETSEPMKSLSYNEKIGLLHIAHAAMIDLLDCYFRGLLRGWHKDVTDIHLRLRLLLEDLVSDEEFKQLKARYFCPFETLSGIEDKHPPFGIEIKSDRWTSSRPKMEGFQGKLAELHIRAGSPGLPSAGPYGVIIKGLKGLFARVRFYSGPYLYDVPDEEYDKFLGGTRKVIAEIQAGFAAIDLRGASVRQSKQDLSTLGFSGKERDEAREGDVSAQAGETVTDRDEYRCSDGLQITGKCRKGRNVVLLNGNEVLLSDGLFKLLLRLAIELSKNPGGWVRAQSLVDEEIITEKVKDNLNKRYSDLRLHFRGYLKEHNDKEFIENDGETGYRLSVPPRCLRCNKSELGKHKTPIIVRLAKLLPRSRRSRK